MRRIISLLLILGLWWSFFDEVLFAQRSDKQPEQETETKVIDLTADIVYPMTLNDTVEVMCLVGNFAAQHNGAIITADSAIRYNDRRLECFGDVLINSNTTYAYADRADYNGETNEVSLYAPIIKIVDGEATMYCYNFRFNTKDKIGVYEGGGVMINGESVMESLTGYYYSDNKELIGVGDVEISGDEYQMKSDSVIYNTQSDDATYFENTNIWNKKDEYLYADAGDYSKSADRYSFSLNGYILTEEQEMWSDSMDYFRATEHIFMRHNIQIDDTTHKSLIFGDYGEYIKTPGDMTLMGDPSIINYDLEQGDSLFMRADTFQIFTLSRFEIDTMEQVSATELAEQVQEEIVSEPDSLQMHEHDHEHDHHDHAHDHEHAHDHAHEQQSLVDAMREKRQEKALSQPTPAEGEAPRVGVGSAAEQDQAVEQDVEVADSLSVDSLAADSVSRAADTLNFWQRIVANYKAKRELRAAEKVKVDAARKVVLDSIGRERQIKINEKLDAEKVRKARQVAQRRAKLAEREKRKIRRAVARGKMSAADTLKLMDSLAVDTTVLIDTPSWRDSLAVDSLAADSLALDSLALDSMALDSVKVDSLYRLTKGYRNVRIYRSDFQAIADSMVTSSIDSIIRLYINPVLWHDANQVTSDVMDIYTANNQIEKAIFTGGSPIMASEIEAPNYYNQVAGKVITSLFADGAIYRNDVDGNAQTLYFMQDDDTKEVNGLMDMESGSATFYIEEQTVVGISYRGEPNYTIYPLSMVPVDQALSLKGFVWQGADRPTREDIFTRTIRPSVREQKSDVPRPQFPIRERLDTQRRELIENGLWLDRTDIVSPHAEEWMESLGYKTGQPREQKE